MEQDTTRDEREPRQDAEPRPPDAPTSADADDADDASGTAGPDTPEPESGAGRSRTRTRGPGERRLRAPSVVAGVTAQWTGHPYPDEPTHLIVLTIPEDPDARPWFDILMGHRPEAFGTVWDETQRASDRTMVGRLARPIVVLEPRAYRWRVARWVSGTLLIREDATFADPVDALRAARTRYGELLRPGSLGDDLDAVARTMGDLAEQADDEEGGPGEGPAGPVPDAPSDGPSSSDAGAASALPDLARSDLDDAAGAVVGQGTDR